MQMKIGRWEGLYPRIQSAKSISAAVSFAATENAEPFRSERSAIIGNAQPGVPVLTPSEDRATKKE
jgi:hypothetical protein